MSQPFLAEIRMFAGNFAPLGWALCNGQIMAISQSTALFSLIGTMYGGNGTTNFALPNLQGNAPMHAGSPGPLTPRSVGEAGGSSSVALAPGELAGHSHTWGCGSGSKGDTNVVSGQVNADEGAGTTSIYATSSDGTRMAANALQPTPASQPHENRQPSQCVNFIIALQGIFPPRS